MLEAIRDFFERNLVAPTPTDNGRHTIEVATAALLVEVMRMDSEISVAEREAGLRAVRAKFGLNEQEAQTLIELGEAQARQATDYYQFTSLINKKFTREQRIRIVELLWEVAYADATLNPHEDHLIRKLADLLYVDHSDYILAKQKARDAAS